MVETTTIQINIGLKTILDKMRIFHRETYNDIIERLVEDTRELNGETKKEIERARLEIKHGKFKTHEQLGKELGL